MKKIQLNITVLIMGVFFGLNVYSYDLMNIAPIFECPFSIDRPLIEQIEFNGITSLKVIFKTKVPFDEMEKYYTSFLKSEGWLVFPVKKSLAFVAKFLPKYKHFPEEDNQLYFVKSRHFIKISYFDLQKNNLFSISLCELKIPSIKMDNREVEHIENIQFPDSEALISYSSLIESLGKVQFLSFKTKDTKPEQVIRHYKNLLLTNGWNVMKPWENFTEALFKFHNFKVTDTLKKIAIMHKGNQKLLFIYASYDKKKSETHFGYLVKEILI